MDRFKKIMQWIAPAAITILSIAALCATFIDTKKFPEVREFLSELSLFSEKALIIYGIVIVSLTVIFIIAVILQQHIIDRRISNHISDRKIQPDDIYDSLEANYPGIKMNRRYLKNSGDILTTIVTKYMMKDNEIYVILTNKEGFYNIINSKINKKRNEMLTLGAKTESCKCGMKTFDSYSIKNKFFAVISYNGTIITITSRNRKEAMKILKNIKCL